MALIHLFLILVIIPSASLLLKSQNTLRNAPFKEVVNYNNLLEKLLSALEKLLKYLSTETLQINLDCVIGIRMVQGQLNVLLRRLNFTADSDPKDFNVITSEYSQRLVEIHDNAEDIAEHTIPSLAKNSPMYYETMKILLSDSIWEYDGRTHDVTDQSLIYSKIMPHETIDPFAAGACLNAVMVSSCHITDECWVLMTQPFWIGYSLTHQILYVMVGEQIQCGKRMQELIIKNNQTSTFHLLNVMCANVVREMNEIYENDGLSDEFIQDLFMEQVALCGLLGFQDTFSITWLNAIISWQKPDGCYGTSDIAVFVASMKLRLGMDVMHNKREEKILGDGCLSHKSGMAAGALAVYIRYVIERIALGINGPPVLEK